VYDQQLVGGLGAPGRRDDGPEPDFVTWLLYLDCADDPARFGALARWWYDETCRMLLPYVEPAGAVRAAVSLTAFEQDASGRGRRRRPAYWADALTAECRQVSARWFDIDPGATVSELDVLLDRFPGSRHVRLQISVGFEGRPGRLPLVVPALVELARRSGDAADPTYGEIVVNAGSPAPATMLDVVLGRDPESSAAASRVRLRGYEWVTICPRELADRLGGPERLRASGAFAEVYPLRHGGVLLRATDDPADYRGDRVRAVFRALAPVLPPGRPGLLPTVPPVDSAMLSAVPGVLTGDPGGHDLSRIVFADARDADLADRHLALGPAAGQRTAGGAALN
jgi:hypothetical protein